VALSAVARACLMSLQVKALITGGKKLDFHARLRMLCAAGRMLREPWEGKVTALMWLASGHY
jgi:hypothetical protein